MQRSRDRFLTTHTGSLPRPDDRGENRPDPDHCRGWFTRQQRRRRRRWAGDERASEHAERCADCAEWRHLHRRHPPQPRAEGRPEIAHHLDRRRQRALGPVGGRHPGDAGDAGRARGHKVDARTGIITTVAGSGVWGYSGDEGPATEARLAGPAGIAVVADPAAPGKLTIFIADFYNQNVRAVGPDGIIRDVSDEGRVAFGAPTRVAFAARRGWLYVADSQRDQLVALPIPRPTAKLIPPRALRT